MQISQRRLRVINCCYKYDVMDVTREDNWAGPMIMIRRFNLILFLFILTERSCMGAHEDLSNKCFFLILI